MIPRAARIYPITDVRLTGLSHAEQVARLIEGGARLIQLREKHLSARDFYGQAKEALSVARACRVRLIINDRADIALALEADGVHLGQDDMPPGAARQLLGPEAIIGFSTHNSEQALNAITLPIDYLALGPIFPTSTKIDSHPPIGLDGVREVRRLIGDFPLVAIGGITEENAAGVLDSGADCVAVISALLKIPAVISEATRRLISTAKPSL